MRLGPDLPKLVGLDRANNGAGGGGNDDRRALVLDPVSLEAFGVICPVPKGAAAAVIAAAGVAAERSEPGSEQRPRRAGSPPC